MPPSAVESFLLHFHADHPGATSLVFGSGRDEQGRSSYDRIAADVAANGGAPAVLDVACGDGFLLERILDTTPGCEAWGLDMSPEELATGRRRLGQRATLVSGRAQELPFEDARFDVVVSHLALMLMPPLEPVIDEIRRVLRPGGRLVAVVGGRGEPSAAQLAYREVLRPLLRAGSPPQLGLVDARALSAEGWSDLLSRGFDGVTATPFVVTSTGSVDEITRYYNLMYDPRFLSEAARHTLVAQLRDRLHALADDGGEVRTHATMLQVTATRSPRS